MSEPTDTGRPAGDRATPSGPAPDDTPTGSMRLVTTTTNTPSRTVGRHAAAGAVDPSADDRGRLQIADAVVEKVAVAAAGEIDDVGGVARRVLGVPAGRDDGEGRPQVSARVTGQVASLDVRLTVMYPASVRSTTEAVREHLRDRVHALTEITVSRVDISVTALPLRGQLQSPGRVIA